MKKYYLVLEIGAKIKLGDVRSANNTEVFIFEGYFGFNPSDPTDNYVYARRSGSPLTIANVIQNFDLGDISLPQSIADSGFYGETIISFSAQGKLLTNNLWSWKQQILVLWNN